MSTSRHPLFTNRFSPNPAAMADKTLPAILQQSSCQYRTFERRQYPDMIQMEEENPPTSGYRSAHVVLE
ncbi:hypothetical protein [Ralstonia solanacearum]|uniref:Uncharacterized protein n=1 Tax=Ralstonia solanacearum TaxID=305 RepID=A0AAE3NG24_RALSL|nr:hypothetical protein [Ralstonia solanacearum]MBB6584498.1 hypothetical protein [Ralstonia solanacearum]MDB0521605.1 hypothetical protein [Ralstonia solanacearum]